MGQLFTFIIFWLVVNCKSCDYLYKIEFVGLNYIDEHQNPSRCQENGNIAQFA